MTNKTKDIPMMITVDDGSRRVPICNILGEEIGSFVFHPTDIGIIERYNTMIKEIDSITKPIDSFEFDENASDEENSQRMLAAKNEATKQLYAAVDNLLASDGAAQIFFGKMNPFSPVDGKFYCEIVLQSIGQYINKQFKVENAKISERAKRYLRKES